MGINIKNNQINAYRNNIFCIENESSYSDDLSVNSVNEEAVYVPSYDSDLDSNSSTNQSLTIPELDECVSSLISKMNDEELDILYEPEEICKTKNNLVMCEPYNQYVYGHFNTHVNSQWIVLSRFRYFEPTVMERLINTHLWTNKQYSLWKKHPFISNYQKICKDMKPQIAECIYLQSGECVCIIKTFWLKIIQRRWKKIYHKYKQENQESSIFHLAYNIYKIITNHKDSYTSSKLYGMLSDI